MRRWRHRFSNPVCCWPCGQPRDTRPGKAKEKWRHGSISHPGTAFRGTAMAQIFSKRSNSVARVSLVGGFLGFFIFWGVVYLIYWSPYTTAQGVPREQEVPFS